MSNDQQFSLITSYRHNFEIISSSFCQQYGKFNQYSRDESLELLFIIHAFRQRYIYLYMRNHLLKIVPSLISRRKMPHRKLYWICLLFNIVCIVLSCWNIDTQTVGHLNNWKMICGCKFNLGLILHVQSNV